MITFYFHAVGHIEDFSFRVNRCGAFGKYHVAVLCGSLLNVRVLPGGCFVGQIRKLCFFRIKDRKGSHRVGIIPVFFGKLYKVLRCFVGKYQPSGLSLQAAAHKRCRKYFTVFRILCLSRRALFFIIRSNLLLHELSQALGAV